ncbi:MAG TPA: fibronectin type III domain-containing protein [Planctomycetota bacterium]|nr:fibronectin type III domain-containing protein [Planctomycetota bacterium]
MEGFSFSEIILIIIIAIIIYGKDLPQAARKMATIYAKFKRQLSDVREEIARQIPMDEIRDSVKMDLPSGPGGEYPTTPSSLIASPSESNVLLTWNSSIGATSYTIRRSTGPQDPWLIIAMNIVELAWTDTDVQPGKTFHYVVSGVNNTGESGNSDEAVAVLPPAPGTAVETAAAALPAPAPAPAPEAPAPSAAAPTNGNGDYPKEPSVPEEKGTAPAEASADKPAPEAKPS